jgi:hypothetical protein
MLSRFSTVIQNAVDAVSLVIRIFQILLIVLICTLTCVLVCYEKHTLFRNLAWKVVQLAFLDAYKGID